MTEAEMTTDGPKKLLRAPEVAELLNMHLKTVYNRTAEGKIPSVRIAVDEIRRYEPLVILAIREGASVEQVKEVAAAVARFVPEADVMKIWRGDVIHLSAKKGGKPSGGAA